MVISYFLNSLGSWVCPAEYDVLVYAGQRTSMQELRNNRDIIRIKYRRNLEFAGLYDISDLKLISVSKNRYNLYPESVRGLNHYYLLLTNEIQISDK